MLPNLLILVTIANSATKYNIACFLQRIRVATRIVLRT